jgi:hypothetical protein
VKKIIFAVFGTLILNSSFGDCRVLEHWYPDPTPNFSYGPGSASGIYGPLSVSEKALGPNGRQFVVERIERSQQHKNGGYKYVECGGAINPQCPDGTRIVKGGDIWSCNPGGANTWPRLTLTQTVVDDSCVAGIKIDGRKQSSINGYDIYDPTVGFKKCVAKSSAQTACEASGGTWTTYSGGAPTGQWCVCTGNKVRDPSRDVCVDKVSNGRIKVCYDPVWIPNGKNCNSSCNENETFSITMTIPDRSGYTFTGWKMPKGEIFLAGRSFKCDAATLGAEAIRNNEATLTAQWRPNAPGGNNITATYNLNGGNIRGSTANIVETCIIGSGSTLRVPGTPSREGHIFDHWKTDRLTFDGASGKYKSVNGTIYCSIEPDPSKDTNANFTYNPTTITAQWKSQQVPDPEITDCRDNSKYLVYRDTVSDQSRGFEHNICLTKEQVCGTYRSKFRDDDWLFIGKENGPRSENISVLCPPAPQGSYTVTYNCNNGTNLSWSSNSTNVNTPITVDGLRSDCTNGNNAFGGWLSNGVTYQAGDTFIGNAAMTYIMTAQWGGVPDDSVGGILVIDGVAKVGETLRANTAGVTGAVGIPTYEWSRWVAPNWSPISGAIINSYLLTSDDLNSQIKVKAMYANGSAESAATATVADIDKPDIDPIDEKWAKIEALNNKFTADGWKDKNGNFNWARLGVDAAAGTVMGVTSGVLTNSLMKKSQLKKGHESIQCIYGQSGSAAYGETFVPR